MVDSEQVILFPAEDKIAKIRKFTDFTVSNPGSMLLDFAAVNLILTMLSHDQMYFSLHIKSDYIRVVKVP